VHHAVIDPELLGQFLDGSATAEERAQVMNLAATSEYAMRELREAATIHGELTGEYVVWPVTATHPVMTPALHVVGADGNCGVPRRAVDRSATGVRYLVPLVMLAAALLAVVFVRVVRAPATRGVAIAQVTRIEGATGAGALTRMLGPGWDDGGYHATRGGGVTPPAARAFSAGVWAARFNVASDARDTLATERLVERLRTLMADVAGASPVIAQLAQLAQLSRTGGGSGVALRATALDQLRMMSGDRRCFDRGAAKAVAHMMVRQSSRRATQEKGLGDDLNIRRRSVAAPQECGAGSASETLE